MELSDEGDQAPYTLTAVACPRLAPLRHVSVLVDSFLISRSWTLEMASERGFVRLLERLLPLEWPGVSEHFRLRRFGGAIDRFISSDQSVAVISWWVTRYLQSQASEAVQSALLGGNIKVLEWLKQQGMCHQDDIKQDLKLCTSESDLAYWFHDNMADVRLSLDVGPTLGETSPDYRYMEYVKWAVQHSDRMVVTGIASAMDDAAFHGLLDDLTWLHDQTSEQCSAKALAQALRNGHLSTAKWLYLKYPGHYFHDPRQLKCDLELIAWAMAEYDWKTEDARVVCIENSILHACRDGENADEVLQVLQLLYSNRPERSVARKVPRRLSGRYQRQRGTEAMDEAASKGLLNVVEWLHFNESGGCTAKAMDKAAANGHLEIVQWLHANRSEGCTVDAMNQAAANGHLEIVKWLNSNRSEGCTTNAMNGAIGNNHIHLVQWLHANRTEGCTRLGMDNAAANADFQMIQWLRDNQLKRCTVEAMNSAATRGDIKMIKWLYECRSGSCTVDTMDLAAEYGHLNVMKYLHANRRCEWTQRALAKAIGNGHTDVVIWLMEMGASEPVHQNVFREAMREAALNGHAAVVAMLAALHCDLDWESDFLNNLANYGQFGILEWALQSCLLRQDVITTTPFLQRNA